jgi:hypothetical protein
MNKLVQTLFSEAACVLLLAAVPACSSDDDTSTVSSNAGHGAADSGTDAGTVTGADTVLGTFVAGLFAPTDSETTGHSTLAGTIYDGETPQQIVWEVAQTVDKCTLSTPRVPFCSTSCGGSAVCDDDDHCQAYPTKKSVGDLHVTGLKTSDGSSDFTIAANDKTKIYQSPTLPFPAFAEGDEIKVQASGSELSAFTITTHGIKALELTSSNLQLSSGNAVELKWPAAASASASSIHVKLDISHHGGSKGMIECDTDDSGSLTIASSLVSALLDRGYAGFPTIIVTRHDDGMAQLSQGIVKLSAWSQVEQAVTIPGLDSCSDASDCPSGQTCQSDLTCK